MSCTFGRITGLQSPNRIKRDGSTLKIGGEFAVTDAQGRALAAEMSGYGVHNPDEPIITFTYDATQVGGELDGFYAVIGVDLDYVKLAAGLFSWDAELLSVTGKRSPLIEVSSSGDDRGGGGVATGKPWVGIPGSVRSFVGPGTYTSATAATDDGTVRIIEDSALYTLGSAVYYEITAANYLKAACTIEMTFDSGTTWYPVVGRDIPTGTTGWRMTNHRSRISVVGTDLRVEYYDGTAWESTDFRMTATLTQLAIPAWSVVTVNRNSPEVTSVRLTSDGLSDLMYLDLTLRRGSHLIEGVVSTLIPRSLEWGIFRTASENGASITGGIEAAAANSPDGNKYILLTPNGFTPDISGTSGITSDAAIVFPFAVGVSNAVLMTGVTATQSYFAANRIRQIVSVR